MMVADGDGSDGAVGARCIAVIVSSVAYLGGESTPCWTLLLRPTLDIGGPTSLPPTRSLASILLHPTQHTIFRPRPCPTFHQGPASSSKPLRSSRYHRHRRRRCARRDGCCTLLPVPYVQMAPNFESSTASMVVCMCEFTMRGQLAPMSMRRILSRELVGVTWFWGH